MTDTSIARTTPQRRASDRQTPATTTLVACDAVRRTYGRGSSAVEALDHATCRIETGDHIALVGPSGSGKSTLLHLLGGLDTPSGGAITWPALGARATLRPQQVSFVFQTASLIASLSVIENVALPLLLLRSTAAAAREAVLAALDQIELAALAEKLPEELSGGQAQRVAIARALVVEPRLILADEPTGQLERVTGQHVIDVLLNAIERTRTACVIATHDLEIAERLPIRWHMLHGRLEDHDDD